MNYPKRCSPIQVLLQLDALQNHFKPSAALHNALSDPTTLSCGWCKIHSVRLLLI